MTLVVTTPRLRLREFAGGHLDVLAAMVADDDQMRFYPRARTRAEAAAWIDRNLRLYESNGFGIWLIESLRTGSFLGYCGIRPLVLDGATAIEMAWHVRKAVWNRGVAAEAAAAARDLAFGRLGVSRLVALVHPDNLASARVAEKLGMHPTETRIVEGEPVVVYALEPA